MKSSKSVKQKKCKNCGDLFTPTFNSLQPTCSILCAITLSKLKDAAKAKKEAVKRKRKELDELMTKGEYIKLLQAVFNTFIRLRDKDLPCISCGCKVSNKWDAGHFYPTTYQALRFNEDNVHKQCSKNCNMEKHGNLAEYRPNLIKKIGLEKVEHLSNTRHNKLNLSIPEIKEMIADYKLKIKQLKN